MKIDKKEQKAEWERPWIKMEKNLKEMKGNKIAEILASCPLPTEYGDWTNVLFGDYTTGVTHDALVFGNWRKGSLGSGRDVLTRIHSSCRSSDIFHATNCECAAELREAMARIKREGKGVIIYLDQEGAGNGLVAKLQAFSKAYAWKNGKIAEARDKNGVISMYDAYERLGYEAERRNYAVAGQMLKALGVKSVRLLTNNPRKIRGIESAGIKVKRESIHIAPSNRMQSTILKAKARRLGHRISKEKWVRKD